MEAQDAACSSALYSDPQRTRQNIQQKSDERADPTDIVIPETFGVSCSERDENGQCSQFDMTYCCPASKQRPPASCADIAMTFVCEQNGQFIIYPFGNNENGQLYELEVFCDFESGEEPRTYLNVNPSKFTSIVF